MGSDLWGTAGRRKGPRRAGLGELLAELHARQAQHDERAATLRYDFELVAPAPPGPLAPGLVKLSDVKRREFLRRLSAASTLLAAPRSIVELDWQRLEHFAGRTRLDDATLDQYATLNQHHWRSFSSATSKSAVFSDVEHQIDVLTGHLANGHRPAVHQRLCCLAADLFQLSGEVLFDASHHADAAQCYTLAANAAKEAEAFDLWACAVTRHAFIAVFERQHRAAIPMLDMAARLALKGDPGLATRQWVHAVRAQAFAGAGELTLCERSLEIAEQVASLPGPGHNGGWLRFDRSRLAEERGACLVELGRPDLAEPVLGKALGQGLSMRRRGIVLADLAAAGAQRRDVDQIVTHGKAALEIARLTGSGVIATRLVGLRPRLSPFGSRWDVRDLSARIDALGSWL